MLLIGHILFTLENCGWVKSNFFLKTGAPGEIRTPDLQLRRLFEYLWSTKNQVFTVAVGW